MRNVNEALLNKMYGPFKEFNKKFASKYPTFGAFAEAVKKDDGRLLTKMYGPFKQFNKKFADKYPTLETFIDKSYSKYLDSQKAAIRENAIEGLSNLYKGDFDTLLANRGKIQDRVSKLKRQRVKFPISSVEGSKIDKQISNLQSASELLEAFDAIEGADSDDNIDLLLEGRLLPTITKEEAIAQMNREDRRGYESLSPMEKENWTPTLGARDNKFLKQVMPTVGYKVMELGSKEPSFWEGIFPEGSRRADRGEGKLSTTLGGAKDLLRLPGRAMRPVLQDVAGVGDPNVSYWEEFARPDKYKTTAQEIFDEVGGFQGLAGAVSRPLARGAVNMPLIGKALGKGAQNIGAIAKPSEVIIDRVRGTSPYLTEVGREVLRQTPSIGLDVAFEGTRASDEDGSPIAAGIGGVLGAGIAPTLGRVFKSDDLTQEILAGTPSQLGHELKLQRSLADPEIFTTKADLDKFAQVQDVLSDQISLAGRDRQEAADALQDILFTTRQETGPTTALQGMFNLPAEAARKLTGASQEAVEQSERMARLPATLLEETSRSRVHPSRQMQAAQETGRAMGINVPESFDEVKSSVLSELDKLPSNQSTIEAKAWIDNAQTLPELMKEVNKIKASEGKDLMAGLRSGSMPDVGKFIEGRTTLREWGEGEGIGSAGSQMYKAAEGISKNIMRDFLPNTAEGKEILKKYQKMAKKYKLAEEMPDITDGAAVDNFLGKIGRSRVNISEKTNTFQDFIDLQDSLNEALKESGQATVDFITPAVLRRIQTRSFWQDVLGDKAGAVDIAVRMAKDLTVDELGSNRLRSIVASITKEANRETTETRKRQEQRPRGDEAIQMQQDVSEATRRWREYIKEQEAKANQIPLAGQ